MIRVGFCRYGEVLKMLGNRSNFPGRLQESLRTRGAGIRRRHGSLSSLPSSSISGRPIRDRRRIEERRKIKDVKVNKSKIFFLLNLKSSYHFHSFPKN